MGRFGLLNAPTGGLKTGEQAETDLLVLRKILRFAGYDVSCCRETAPIAGTSCGERICVAWLTPPYFMGFC